MMEPRRRGRRDVIWPRRSEPRPVCRSYSPHLHHQLLCVSDREARHADFQNQIFQVREAVEDIECFFGTVGNECWGHVSACSKIECGSLFGTTKYSLLTGSNICSVNSWSHAFVTSDHQVEIRHMMFSSPSADGFH
jgi:hypothetical protein